VARLLLFEEGDLEALHAHSTKIARVLFHSISVIYMQWWT